MAADNRQAIAARYGVVRPFVRLLAETLPLHAAPAGAALLTEIRGGLPTLLRRQISRKPLAAADLNVALVPPMWRGAGQYTGTLDAAWRQLAQRIEEAGPDASVRVVPGEAGRMRLSVQRLAKLGAPSSPVDLRKRVVGMLPVVDLPELLMDVHSWTGMLDAYTHVGGLATSMDQLPVTVATGSRPASQTWAVPASGAPTCPASSPGTTGP